MSENQVIIILFLGIVLGVFVGYIFAKISFLKSVKSHRKSAVQKSRSVVLGQVSEQLAPLLPKFPYNYKDVSFLGKGVDYIVFDGLADGFVENIVFLEVKTGTSRLNKNEKLIRQAVQSGNVKYDIFRC